MEMDKTVMIQVKCKGMKKSEMHIVSYSDGTEVNKDVDGDLYIIGAVCHKSDYFAMLCNDGQL